MADPLQRVYVCPCEHCRRTPHGDGARNHRAINRIAATLDERGRRLFVGVLASQRGGRRRLEKKEPGVVTALHEAVQDATAGDPISGLRWTHKTTRNLAEELRRQGFSISHTSIDRLLRQSRYSLRTNRKRLARTCEPERDQQFRLMQRQRQRFGRCGWPVISVNTKKKELAGNFKNPGRCWRKQAVAVLDHDFPSAAAGRAIPYGIYDQAQNAGYVVVGTSAETAAFAIEALQTWWLETGPGAIRERRGC